MKKERIYILVGQTAVGKTAVSIHLAKMMGAEIVSADSVQVYKTLDIGSAKPTLIEQDGIPHHMLSIVDVDEKHFSVSSYRDMAINCIADIHARHKTALIVGGTGLYINALSSPLQFAGVPADETVRSRLNKLEDENPGYLYARLREIDPETALRLHPNDKKRVARALEVYEVSQKPMSTFNTDFHNESKEEAMYDVCMAGLSMDRAELYKRIEMRIDIMIKQGLAEEVKKIYDAGYYRELPALQALGYKQFLMYYNNEITLSDAIEKIKKETRHFAKRQWTWFKRDKRIHWFDCTDAVSPKVTANKIYNYFSTGI